MDFAEYKREKSEKKLLMKLWEAEEAVKDESAWMSLDELKKFVPEVRAEPDEIQALEDGRRDRAENGTISHEAINWD